MMKVVAKSFLKWVVFAAFAICLVTSINLFIIFSAEPSPGPSVWYKFDETSGTTAADSSGNGKNATLTSATWAAGRTGNAVSLNGSSQYVSMPTGMVSTLNDFSIATWVRLNNLSTWSRIFDFGSSTTVNMFLTPQSGSGVRFAITTNGSGSEQRITGSSALVTGAWVHVAVTLSGSIGILYVNGTSVGTNTSMTLKPSSLGSTSRNYIGRSQYSDPYLNGLIDDFRIYPRALSASEIQMLISGSTPSSTPSGPTPAPTQITTGYLNRIEPAPGTKINSAFWNARIKNVIVNWIPYCYNQLSNTSLAEGGIDNFVQAANKLAGRSYKAHVGYWFSNAYVHNTVEAMCNACMIDPQGDSAIISAQNAMKTKLEDWIPRILSAAESDGYLHTWTTLGNNARWNDRAAHEGYTGGYFIESAIAHYMMTNKTDTRLYNAAKKLADCWYNNVGPGKKVWWDGHEEMEQALGRLAAFVNENEGAGKGDKYIQLSKALMDGRYSSSNGQYDQSHAYPINQTTAVGHAVRAMYLYSGMTEVGMQLNNSSYLNAVNKIWDNFVNRKLYVTGGVGSGETSEGFGNDYSLPNSAYAESCANCGMLIFMSKMNYMYADGKYADLMELPLYNGILGSLDLNAQNFTYTNPLDSSAARYKWHNCPCCVGNIPKTTLALPRWMYAKGGDNNSIYVNMYIGSTFTINSVAGTSVQMVQTTDYPINGNVSITVNPSAAKNFTIYLHAPDRSVSTIYSSTPDSNGITSITVNGSAVSTSSSKGYVAITRTWTMGDKIDIVLPMMVQRVKAISNVAADSGRVALMYGPLVYNIESVDQDVNLILNPSSALTVQWNGSLLGGVNVIKGFFTSGAALTAIPNYARLNRGGRSIVWLRDQ